MNYTNAALDALARAELDVGALLRQALDAGAYNDVRRLADLAGALDAIRKRCGGNPVRSSQTSLTSHAPAEPAEKSDLGPLSRMAFDSLADDSLEQRASDISPTPPSASASRIAKELPRSGYPRFERESDRLVKIGWSVKEKREYEHRVQRSVVLDVAACLAGKAKPNRPFRMEKILPIVDRGGAEIPSYQAYLVLKWLQVRGAVERRGNDGYVLGKLTLDTGVIESLWESTQQRMNSHGEKNE